MINKHPLSYTRLVISSSYKESLFAALTNAILTKVIYVLFLIFHGISTDQQQALRTLWIKKTNCIKRSSPISANIFLTCSIILLIKHVINDNINTHNFKLLDQL